MSRKMAWLALALVAMLVMLPLLATGNLWPELPPQADKPAALPQYLQPINSRSLAVPPEPIPPSAGGAGCDEAFFIAPDGHERAPAPATAGYGHAA